MIEVWVAGISAVLEPSASACATTEFAGFLDAGALGTRVAAYLAAYRGCAGRRRRGCCCGHVNVKRHETRAHEHANASNKNNRYPHHCIEAAMQQHRQW